MELHQHTCSDMYILDAFKDAGRIVGELRKRGLFRKVVLIGTERVYNKNKTVNKRTLKSSLGTFGTYFDVREIVEGYIEKDAVYDEMYFSCNQLSFRLARFYFIKKGYPTRFVMYDEGAGSYDGHFERVKFTDAFVRRILFGKRAGNSGLDLYLYQPELYFAYEKEKHRLHKICPFDETDKAYLDDYNAIFNSIAVETAGKHIYFDTLREEVVVTEEALVSMQQWYDMIEDALGAENILVKPHPRAFRKYPHNAEDFAASDCPMEINYLSMDLDDLGSVDLLEGLDDTVPVGLLGVKLVDGDYEGNAVLVGITGENLGADLGSLLCVDDKHRGLHDLERGNGAAAEIIGSRSIDNVELLVQHLCIQGSGID